MIGRLACAAILAAAQGQAEEKPHYPPFTLVITAKTGKLVPGDIAPLLNAIKAMKGYAEQISRQRVAGDWMEAWTFEIAGDRKFDPGLFMNAFARYNAIKYHLTLTGTLSQEAQTKKLFITSFSGKSKVKLMNRPKGQFDDPDKKTEDTVGKLAALFSDGKLHYTVSGEIFNHGGTLAIILASYEEASPPPPKPKDDKK
jgi:hypothetical protein